MRHFTSNDQIITIISASDRVDRIDISVLCAALARPATPNACLEALLEPPAERSTLDRSRDLPCIGPFGPVLRSGQIIAPAFRLSSL
jgi:hypothetical protein